MAKEKNKNKPLSIKKFQLEQLTFELRFDAWNYYFYKLPRFWDEIENHLKGRFSNFANEDNGTSAKYNDKFEVRVSSDRFAVFQLYSDPSINEFLQVSQALYETMAKILEIREIPRVGLRALYAKEYDDPIAVAKELYQSPYINYPKDLYLSEDSIPLIPNLSMGWQNEEKGITYRLRGESAKIGIKFPFKLVASGKVKEESIEETYNQMILDIDIYIHKTFLPGQFFVSEWIQQAFNTLEKEYPKFTGEK